MNTAHCAWAPGDHYYVWVMAVSREAQGKGCCRFVLYAVSGLADRKKVDCYLETVGARNISVYEKLGYEHVKDYILEVPQDESTDLKEESGELTMAVMVRRP